MKPKVVTSSLARNRFLFVFTLTLTCFIAASQPVKTRLQPTVYKNFIKTNGMVKVQTIEGERVRDTAKTTITNLEIPANKKQVISYENKISAIDKSSYEKLKATSAVTDAKDNINIIPELHVEPTGDQAEPVTYRILFTLQQPLHYDDNLKKFIARIGFFLMSESGSNDSPIQPVGVEVVSNDASSVTPGSIKIDHLSIPSVFVDLVVDKVNDSAAVRVITVSHPEGYVTYLKVKPTLEISSNSTSLQGLGIQDIPVNVRFVGSNSSDSVKVSFSTQKGTVTPNDVYLSYNNPATVYLRSDGLGNSILSATSSIADSNVLQFRYVFPWLFLLAAIIGGLIGSLAKYFLGKDEKGSAIKPIIGGILIGLIGAAAWYGLGVNLLGVSLSPALNAFAVLALSALSAYFGISLIKMDGKA